VPCHQQGGARQGRRLAILATNISIYINKKHIYLNSTEQKEQQQQQKQQQEEKVDSEVT